jgi:hypothetical protein
VCAWSACRASAWGAGLPTDRYLEVREISTSVIVVDLDTNTIRQDEELPIPALPHRQESKLRKGLRRYADAYSFRDPTWATTVLPTRDLAFKFAARPCDEEAGPVYVPDWDMTRQTFFRFFVSVLLDYRKYLVFPSRETPKPEQVGCLRWCCACACVLRFVRACVRARLCV